MIPSIDACFKFMDTYEMPSHIRAHSIMVERIASLLATALKKAGVKLSLDKVRAGALMHDIGKPLCIQTGEDHSAKGEEICLLNRLNEIAEIVAEHVVLKDYRPGGPITEKELVYYADKRVNHDTVVSLEVRLQYLLERYGQEKEHLNRAIMKNFERCKELERRIFARLTFGPGDLAKMLQAE
jgi:uncharacterized protein